MHLYTHTHTHTHTPECRVRPDPPHRRVGRARVPSELRRRVNSPPDPSDISCSSRSSPLRTTAVKRWLVVATVVSWGRTDSPDDSTHPRVATRTVLRVGRVLLVLVGVLLLLPPVRPLPHSSDCPLLSVAGVEPLPPSAPPG